VNQTTSNHQICLTERGFNQARHAGQRLVTLLRENERVLVYTSPYKRARQTANEITAVLRDSGVEYRTREEPRLREQDFGNFQGDQQEMQRIWMDRARYGHFFYRIPHGESAADVYDRCAGFNETLFRQFNSDKFPEVLVLVTHGIWARVFLMKWFRWSYEKFESLRNLRHCQFVVMECADGAEDKMKYYLKTRLLTWDDQDDSDDASIEELEEASGGDVSVEDLKLIRAKEKKIKEQFQRVINNIVA
jgi:broad specificity phosphatase PhoE